MSNEHTDPLHHHHHRRLIYKVLSLFPGQTPWQKFLDELIYPVALVGPIAFIPQVTEVWTLRDASNLSPVTWTIMTGVSSIWIMYGISHKARAITVAHCCWFVMNGLMAIASWIF